MYVTLNERVTPEQKALGAVFGHEEYEYESVF